MNKNLTTTNQNAKLALNKSKNLLNVTQTILEKEDYKWIEKLWKWADENEIDESIWVSDVNFINGGYFRNIPKDKNKLLVLRELCIIGQKLIYMSRELSNIKTLKEIWLNSNNLRSLPEFIYNLTNIECIVLTDNLITNLSEGIDSFNKLNHLDISDNLLQDLPMNISSLSSLKCLFLNENQLNILPDEICELTNLKELTLNRNRLKKISKKISNLKSLKVLTLGGNELSILPDEICELTNLNILVLDSNLDLVLTKNQKEWIKKLKKQGCEVYIDDDLFERTFLCNTDTLTDIEANNKIWIDTYTNLMWQVDVDNNTYSFDDSLEYINKLNKEKYGGYNDWRLPTVDELKSITTSVHYISTKNKYNKIKKPLLESLNLNSDINWYWTNTYYPGATRWVFSICFLNGRVDDSNINSDLYVRCTREHKAKFINKNDCFDVLEEKYNKYQVPDIDISNDEIPF